MTIETHAAHKLRVNVRKYRDPDCLENEATQLKGLEHVTFEHAQIWIRISDLFIK